MFVPASVVKANESPEPQIDWKLIARSSLLPPVKFPSITCLSQMRYRQAKYLRQLRLFLMAG
jgi:hypothetical protein